MEKQKVYIVTTGEYSDYGIEAVFLDRALAERYVEQLRKDINYDSLQIEEHDVETSVGNRVLVHVVEWSEQPTYELTAPTNQWTSWTRWAWEDETPKRPEITEYRVYGQNIRADCVDKALAEKAAQDRVAKYLAEKAGIADR